MLFRSLSGQAIKARFSFFSDTFVEADGWYIDDAGIEIDVFETSGTWVSPPLAPDPLFGYGWLDGWYEQPEGTTLHLDVLDSQLNPIIAHQNLTLPATMALDPQEHSSVHIRVRMTTNDTYVTPLVHSLSLGRTTYIGPSHVRGYADGLNATQINADGQLVVQDPFSLVLPSFVACPFDGFRSTTFGDNLTIAMTNQQLLSSAHVLQPAATTYRNFSLGGDLAVLPAFTLSGSGGEVFERAKIELDCVRPTDDPQLDLGWNNATVFDWPPSGMSTTFGLNAQWAGALVNGTPLVWQPEQAAPSLSVVDASAVFEYRSLQRAAAQGTEASMTLLLTNRSSGSTVTINGVDLPTDEGDAALTYTTQTACPSMTQAGVFSNNYSIYSCLVTINVTGEVNLKVVNFRHLAAESLIRIDLNATVLNNAKAASVTGDVRAVLDIPLHVQTEEGGLRVGLSANTLPLMTERIDPPLYTRWLPETTVTFTTHHHRENPLDSNEDAPDIESVDFYLSSLNSIDQEIGRAHV